MNLEGQALGNGGLAHPRLADIDGVILAASTQHLDGPFDLRLTPNERIDLVGFGACDQVHGERCQRVAPCGRGVLVRLGRDGL